MNREEDTAFYEFSHFRLELAGRRLMDSRDESVISLPPKSFDLLLLLVRNENILVTKEMIFNRIWDERFVEENNLTVRISELRKALGEKRGGDKFIETASGRGYRFVAEVRSGVKSHSHLKIPVEATDSLAVLPFVNQSREPDLDYLADGIMECVINNISQLSQIKVISRNTVSIFKGDEIDFRQIGNRLGVQAVLTGRLLQVGDYFILSVALIKSADNSQIWGARFRCQSSDIFETQELIAKDVAAVLRLKLTGTEKGLLAKRYTENTKVYHLYLKGRYFFNKRSFEGITSAIDYFEQAIEKDSRHALAYSGLADCYITLFSFGFRSREDAFPKAESAVTEALALDDSLAEAHASLAHIKFHYRNWAEAEKEFKRSVELSPNYAQAHFWFASYLAATGRFDEAFLELDKAQKIDPLSLAVNKSICKTLYLSRRYDEAIEKCLEALEIDAGYEQAIGILGLAYIGKGLYDEALLEFKKVIKFPEGGQFSDKNERLFSQSIKKAFSLEANPEAIGMLGYIYAVKGKKREAVEILEGLKKLSKQRYVEPFTIAYVCLGLGDKVQTLEWLEKAYVEQSMILSFLKVYPMFDSLRSDARFQNLLRRVGFDS